MAEGGGGGTRGSGNSSDVSRDAPGRIQSNRRLTESEEKWVEQCAREHRSTRFDRRIDIIARKALLRVMARGEDAEVVRAALEWIKFRDRGRPVKDKSAKKKEEKVESQTEDIVTELSRKLMRNK